MRLRFPSRAGLQRRTVRAATAARLSLARVHARRQLSRRMHGDAKVQLGSGTRPFPGWINIDIERSLHPNVRLDLRAGFPAPRESASFIYSEHVFEHLTLDSGRRLFADCHRALRPGGVMRVAMPDLGYIAGRYIEGRLDGDDVPESPEDLVYRSIDSPAHLLNYALRSWGHLYLYDQAELSLRLRQAGFAHVAVCDPGVSRHAELTGLEGRSESRLIVEATKAQAQAPSGGLPDIAVVVITYNHEAFVADSLRSVLEQDYPGTIHLVVADDASTDATQSVIVRVLAEAPPGIRANPILRDENVGGYANLSTAWLAAVETGAPYIALLEGDDSWTDPRKLALQVEHMEENPGTTLSFALARELIVSDGQEHDGGVVIRPPIERPTFDDLLAGNFVHTCTVVYRAGLLPRFPPWFGDCPFRDWPLHLVHASVGDIHFLPQIVAVHRQHSMSKWWNPARPTRDKVDGTVRAQRLAIQHLGVNVAINRRHAAAGRQRWRARASRSRPERWAHMIAAAALDPRLVSRKLGRRIHAPSGAAAPDRSRAGVAKSLDSTSVDKLAEHHERAT